MGLTTEQENVRDIHGKNMLVSAAAGSGKTFVLVERIIKEILDEKKGVDVDRILVVTFTIAAASEMKERIRKAIDKSIVERPSDARIRAQSTLIHNAHIRTIDSFCSWVVKNYFYEIDRDPAFRIGTAGELKMLSEEVFEEILGEYLASKDEDFMTLADAYIEQNKVGKFKDIVQTLHEKAVSFAWTDEWYDDALRIYDIDSVEDLQKAEFIQDILKKTDTLLQYYYENVVDILRENTTDLSGKSDKDLPTLEKEKGLLLNALIATDFNGKCEALNAFTFPTYSAKNLSFEFEDTKAVAKDLRDQYKKDILDLKDKYFNLDINQLFDSLLYVKKQATTLISFTRDYTNRLYQEKCKRNIFDFNDIEHMALEILRNKDSKDHEKRPVAIELSQHFVEVMVDEYQDSNQLQEQILTAVSNGDNYFTVGDVKQSIYAFRQATPQLFIEKMKAYPFDKDSGNSIRVDLDNNFRSRKEVLDFCNEVFAPMMQTDIGGVEYDDRAALKVGAADFVYTDSDYQPEVIIANQDKDLMSELDIANKDALQGFIVAKKIKELKAKDFQVSTKVNDKRALRSLKYSDIVILLSAVSGHGDSYVQALRDSGIPAYLEEETGFFEREEIQIVLSMLTIIDNPFNDIPLASVLHSPMFNFSSNRLAEIRATDIEDNLYGCLLKYKESHQAKDVDNFFCHLNRFREMAVDTPIHEIIEAVLEETGYGNYVKALPLGKMASGNLDKLVDEAISFEGTSFKGLARFVSYIDGLKTYDQDIGLAKTVGENDDAVRIMTIHKSKGLEFPVVFVCGCEGGLRKDDNLFAFDQDYGFALEYKNPEKRISYKPCFYNFIKEKSEDRQLGEFYRKYYVALTRPVDKLILVGAIAPTTKQSVEDILASYKAKGKVLDYFTKKKAKSALEIIIRSLKASGSKVQPVIVSCEELFVDKVEETISALEIKNDVLNILGQDYDMENCPIVNTISFEYANLEDSNYKSKYSVSEIKHQAMEDAFAFNEDAAPAFIHNEDESYIPAFMRGQEEYEKLKEDKVPSGALFGTAMHRFMECFDFARENFADSFEEQLDYMKTVHSMDEDQLKRIRHDKLKTFLKDDVAMRMSAAALKGKLYKEKPFVFGGTAKSLFGDENTSEEMILVQGIIDVFFEEEDGIVLLDYKTDRVDSDNDLVVRYEKQLQLYKSAIEKAYNVPVKETVLYSFALEKTVRVPLD